MSSYKIADAVHPAYVETFRQTGILSAAKRQALTTLWHARVLTLSRPDLNGFCKGRWWGSHLNPPVAPVVVVDLERDGLLVRHMRRISGVGGYYGRAYFTAAGEKIAEELVKEGGEPLRYASE